MTNIESLPFTVQRILAKRPFTYLQRCMECGHYRVMPGIHSVIHSGKSGKVCHGCWINAFIDEQELPEKGEL